MSVQGIRKCKCGVYDTYGYKAEVTVFSGGFWSLGAVKVPSVWAKFISDNNNVAAGTVPPDQDPDWEVALPTLLPGLTNVEPTNEGDYNRCFDVCGARAFLHGGANYVAYILYFESVGAIEGTDYEDSAAPSCICIINADTQELLTTFQVPRIVSGGTQYWYLQYMAAASNGATSQFPAVNHGVSADSWVVAGYGSNIHQSLGGAWVQRHRFSTGESGIALNEPPIEATNLHLIQLPAQASNDGLPWVVTKNPETGQVWTGPWLNSEVGDITDPSSHLAQLIGDELVNRLDNKPGGVSGMQPRAYTRRLGIDYVLASDGGDYAYYDGVRDAWTAVEWAPQNLYAFDDGTVVLGSGARLELHAADGSVIWTQDSGGSGANFYGINLSGNGKWVHANAFQVSYVDVFTLATADLTAYGTTHWEQDIERTGPGRDALGWSFSRRATSGAPAIKVPHREYDHKLTYDLDDTPEGTPDAVYLDRRYTTLLLWEYNDGGYREVYYFAQGRNFDAVPSCPCCDDVPDDDTSF